jgi:hypothetical protein
MTKEEYIKGITDSRIMDNPDAVSSFLVQLAILPDDQKLALIKGFVLQIGEQKLQENTESLQGIETRFAQEKEAQQAKLLLEQSIIADILQENQIGEPT